ncbi:hypothetical protein BDF19DRAFT_439757 [Syncephalis fuscata]|nr:hypothetical protein BDF19DRAFT_439757 [Syncephalis fuscata]
MFPWTKKKKPQQRLSCLTPSRKMLIPLPNILKKKTFPVVQQTLRALKNDMANVFTSSPLVPSVRKPVTAAKAPEPSSNLVASPDNKECAATLLKANQTSPLADKEKGIAQQPDAPPASAESNSSENASIESSADEKKNTRSTSFVFAVPARLSLRKPTQGVKNKSVNKPAPKKSQLNSIRDYFYNTSTTSNTNKAVSTDKLDKPTKFALPLSTQASKSSPILPSSPFSDDDDDAKPLCRPFIFKRKFDEDIEPPSKSPELLLKSKDFSLIGRSNTMPDAVDFWGGERGRAASPSQSLGGSSTNRRSLSPSDQFQDRVMSKRTRVSVSTEKLPSRRYTKRANSESAVNQMPKCYNQAIPRTPPSSRSSASCSSASSVDDDESDHLPPATEQCILTEKDTFMSPCPTMPLDSLKGYMDNPFA